MRDTYEYIAFYIYSKCLTSIVSFEKKVDIELLGQFFSETSIQNYGITCQNSSS